MLLNLRAARLLCIAAKRNHLISISQVRLIKLEPIPINDTQGLQESFEQKNERLKRPLSPHIAIYSFPLAAMLSISHRISGIMLVGYCIFIGLTIRYGNIEDVVTFIKSMELSPSTIYAAKAVFLYPLTFHAFNGLRHLIWDCGLGLTNKGVSITGYAVLALSFVASVYVANL